MPLENPKRSAQPEPRLAQAARLNSKPKVAPLDDGSIVVLYAPISALSCVLSCSTSFLVGGVDFAFSESTFAVDGSGNVYVANGRN